MVKIASEEFQEWLDTQSRFHDYSYRNMLLIKHQYPAATKTAGYNMWWNEFDRHVQEGEQAIWIWESILYKEIIFTVNIKPNSYFVGFYIKYMGVRSPLEVVIYISLLIVLGSVIGSIIFNKYRAAIISLSSFFILLSIILSSNDSILNLLSAISFSIGIIIFIVFLYIILKTD